MRNRSEDTLWDQFFDAICVLSVFGAIAAVYVWSSDICDLGMELKCSSEALEFFAYAFNPITLFLWICMSVMTLFSEDFFKSILVIFFGTSLLFLMVRGVFVMLGWLFSKIFGAAINTSEDLYVPSKDENDKEGKL